ncbi:MAG: DUF5009 domain-containing protein [Prevotellaceae bacterium]|nr:DUF5009 domain-containing protein [Prevotellaceae bacterium]
MMRQRLLSLDILRGLDLFLLVFLQPVLWKWLSLCDVPWTEALRRQLDHEVWQGFRFWDLVMPLFLFMSGVSMPFSLSKYLKGEAPLRAACGRIVRRCVLLFLLGMVVQGNLLGFDPDAIYLYTNTLQAIAVGYLLASIVVLRLPWRGQIVAAALLTAAYAVPMTLAGDFSPEGNLANRIDSVVLGRFRGDPTYTWLLSSLNFGVTVWLGAACGQIIRRTERTKPGQTALRLAFVGLGLVAGGLLWGLEMPVIKRIWTSSMTLFSGGLCFLLMAAFYYWIDVKGHVRGLLWLRIYGMNSIAAYMLGETIDFRSVVHSLSYGLAPRMGDYYGVWLTFGNFLIVFLILYALFRAKIFIKV